MNSIKVGRSIALLRKKYGMTQLELAERLSVTDKAVSRWERGLGTPDISLLVKLSTILDIDVETLLEGNVSIDDLGWKGVLFLDYPDGILPTDLVYTKRIIYLQLCYFPLAGITDVLVVGNEKNINTVKEIVSNVHGLHFLYEISSSNRPIPDDERIREYNTQDGIMMLSGFDIIYGKDFTKCLRRVMNNCHKSTRIHTFENKETSFLFYPRKSVAKVKEGRFEQCAEKYLLERGVFVLSVKNHNDLIDAGNFLRILELHQDEVYMNLDQIMERRHINM